MWIKNVKDIATSWMYKYEASYSGTWAKENGLHKILPLYDNDRRVAALSGTHASAHERAVAFDVSRSKAKDVPDYASSSSESSSMSSTPPTILKRTVTPQKRKNTSAQKASGSDAGKKTITRKPSKSKPVVSD